MDHREEYLSAEQVEKLRDFTPPMPPPALRRRKGTKRVAAVINAMNRVKGLTEFTISDLTSHLAELNLIEDLWQFSAGGSSRTFGDLCGEGALGLKHHEERRRVNGKLKPVRVYEIPEGGITEAYCAEHRIELVDDPKAPDPEPVDATVIDGTVIDSTTDGIDGATEVITTAVDCE